MCSLKLPSIETLDRSKTSRRPQGGKPQRSRKYNEEEGISRQRCTRAGAYARMTPESLGVASALVRVSHGAPTRQKRVCELFARAGEHALSSNENQDIRSA